MTSHQEQNAAIRDQFAKQAERYAKLTRTAKDGSVQLSDAVALTAEDTVLDVGCGPGRLTLALAKIAKRATGIDLTPEMLAQARAAEAAQGVTNVTWHQGDILPLPFDDCAFTIVVTQATFHHLADPGAVLRQMARVCAKGGRIAVVDMLFETEKGRAFDVIERLRDPSHLRVLSVEELRALGRAAGLDEQGCHRAPTTLPMDAVLATSFPAQGDMERVREAYRDDLASGEDRLGLGLHEKNGVVFGVYPMTAMVWRRM